MFVQLDVAVDEETGLNRERQTKPVCKFCPPFQAVAVCGMLNLCQFTLSQFQRSRGHASWAVLSHFPDLTRNKCQAVISWFADLDYLDFLF